MLGEGLVVFSSFARRRPIRLAANFYTRTTLAAWKPFGPLVRSNSTVSPSFKLRYPFSWIAEKCTNTSSPVERWMNPYPLAPLNHLTVPFSLTNTTPFASSSYVPLSCRNQDKRRGWCLAVVSHATKKAGGTQLD